MAIYIPYSFTPFITSIIGTLIWNYDIFHLSKCATEPLEISDDDMVIIPRMREHAMHRNHRIHTHTANRNRNRNRNRQGININMNMINPLTELLEPLNNIHNTQLGEANANEPEVRQSDVRQITEMGFEEEQARNALVRSRNNVQRAVDMLLNEN